MEFQDSLKDLLTIDCDIENKLQVLNTTKSREVQDRASNEIKTLLKDFRDRIKELKDTYQLTSSKSADKDKKDVILKELEVQFDLLTRKEASFRQVLFACNKRITNLERDALFNQDQGDTTDNLNTTRQRNVDKDAAVKQSKLNTTILADLNRNLKSTVAQSSDSLNVLIKSSDNIKNVKSEFTTMSQNINDAKRVLTKYDTREFTNKLLIVFSMILFFSVVLYLIWKRL